MLQGRQVKCSPEWRLSENRGYLDEWHESAAGNVSYKSIKTNYSSVNISKKKRRIYRLECNGKAHTWIMAHLKWNYVYSFRI